MPLPQAIEELLSIAMAEAVGTQSKALEPLHVLIAILRIAYPTVNEALQANSIDPVNLRRRARRFIVKGTVKNEKGPQRISNRVMNLLDSARQLAAAENQSMNARYLLIALLEQPDAGLRQFLKDESLPIERLLKDLRSITPEVGPAQEPAADEKGLIQPGDHPATPTIDRHGKDYTALARAGRIDPVIGRREEIKQVVRILLRKLKNNPVLIGDAGVGKTSIVEGLALRIVADDAPAEIRNLRLVEVILSSVIAGTKYRGEFEERLGKLIEEAESDPQLVIFLDEIHTLVGAGSGSSAMDAANILKPALARGRIRCIGATTSAEYRRYIEKDAALERRFHPVRVEEPTPQQAREILAGLRSTYEVHHNVKISDEALDAAVELSVRYVTERRLPDKACDLIDQAAVNKRFLTFSPIPVGAQSRPEITREDVARVVAQWTGIPVERLTADQQQRLKGMEDALRRRVVGQNQAVEAVAQVVRTAMAGLSRRERPYGVLLFTGPTGVGKTELAKALAEFLFDDERRLLRFDMSEYMEEHSVSKLIGSPPGYVGYEEGGQLTEAVRRSPYCVILFDEIEKAHRKISDLFLQIFDDGRLTDAQGRLVDFRNTIIILTSNLNTRGDERKARLGFVPSTPEAEEPAQGELGADGEASPEVFQKILLSHFRPELINRINRIIEFHPLGPVGVRAIIDKVIRRIQEQLSDKKITLRLASAAYDRLMKLGYKPQWGAREMERVIEQQIVQPLARGILDGRFKPGEIVYVDATARGIVLSTPEDVQETAEEVLADEDRLHTLLMPAITEDAAMLLLDIVKSTPMVLKDGDTVFSDQIARLEKTLRSHSRAGEMRLLKCTGDGFLALYPSVTTAVEVARNLQSFSASIDLRFVVHWGSIKISFGGDALGAEVHRLFRVEAIRDTDRVEDTDGIDLPEHGRIVITREALDQLPEDERASFERVGVFRLKGFDEPEEIWAERAIGE